MARSEEAPGMRIKKGGSLNWSRRRLNEAMVERQASTCNRYMVNFITIRNRLLLSIIFSSSTTCIQLSSCAGVILELLLWCWCCDVVVVVKTKNNPVFDGFSGCYCGFLIILLLWLVLLLKI